jgi:IclR family mhp operon transcriptional activator
MSESDPERTDSKARDTQRGVRRTIAVIRALNTLDMASVSEISRLTSISRPAVYRILETLQEERLIARHPSGDSYHLDIGIRSLSDGFRDEDWVLGIVAPIVNKLQKAIIWPTNFGTFRNHSIVIRHTSRRQSPLVIDNATVGLAVPLLETAMGLAYLAACSPREQVEILSVLGKISAPGEVHSQGDSIIRNLIETTKARGYATRPGNFMPATRSMAVPVMLADRPVGVIAFTYFTSSCSTAEAVERYLPSLLSAQKALSESLAGVGMN